MKKIYGKKAYFYDVGDGLTLVNVVTKNDDGEIVSVKTYLGAEGFEFSQVGSAGDLSAPGMMFTYSSYVKDQEGLLDYYIQCLERNTGIRVHKTGNRTWFESLR